MITKPFCIQELEQSLNQEISISSSDSLEDFMRYGKKEEDQCQYLMEGDQLVGLKLRSIALKDESFLDDTAFYAIKALYLADNELSDLHIPAEFSSLEYLNIEDNQTLSTLSFGDAMPHLKSIHASDSGLVSLFLTDCPALNSLDISRNKLANFTFTSACPKLRMMDLSGNDGLNTIHLPNGFEQLHFLHLGDCKLKNLQIKGHLPNLRVLGIKNNQLKNLPADIILDAPLDMLYANGNRPKNIPWVFLNNRNSLESARIWFQELRDHPNDIEANKVVKLMISGNGNVGKSTLMCALQAKELHCLHGEGGHNSTHGIQLGVWKHDDIEFKYWDFGGQEVYHGTHILFMSSDAVQLIVYDSETEKAARIGIKTSNRSKEDEQLINNHPIPYWVETIKQSSKFSEFLIVQNKMNKYPAVDPKVLDEIKEENILRLEIDTFTSQNMGTLQGQLKTKAKNLSDFGMLMPSSWLKARQFFIDNDSKLEEDRQRLISETYFHDIICEGINEKSRELLKSYLHHGGYMYTHEKLNGKIIADQGWALKAIYKPLARDGEHVRSFKRQKGKVYVDELFDVFGSHYTDDEKWLFLQFMENCGLCFKLYQGKPSYESYRSLEDVYVFPEFLQEKQPAKIEEWISHNNPVLLQYDMSWVDRRLIHQFIWNLGQKTEIDNIWKNGILLKQIEGWVLVHLDESPPSIKVRLMEKAMPRWCKLILSEFPNNFNWKISKDNGRNFTDFDVEEWSKKNGGNVEHLRAETEGNEQKLTAVLDDTPTKWEREKVLFLSAIPISEDRLSIEKEYYYIQEELGNENCDDQLRISPRGRIRWVDLNKEIDKGKPDIIHFVGHGEQQDDKSNRGGGLYFSSDDGRSAELISVRKLAAFFENIQTSQAQLKLVFLNACFTEPLARAISLNNKVYAIGTDSKVGSTEARRIASSFYQKYAVTKDIKAAAKYAANIDVQSKTHLYFEGQEVEL